MERKTCIVVGGGLAGLVAARNLGLQGWDVTVLEKEQHLGGKAAAVCKGGPVPIEHGYHVFPRWYENTRGLLEEINRERRERRETPIRLIDFDGFNYLKPGGDYVKMHGMKDFSATSRNLFDNFLPWYFQYLYVFSVIDMLGTAMDHSSPLDEVSQIGFIRERFYATNALAHQNRENMLKGSAIPAHQMSLITAKRVAGYWLAQASPFVSILPGNLRDWFITPLAESAQRAGVKFRMGTDVQAMNVRYVRVEGRPRPTLGSITIRRCDDGNSEETLAASAYVFATPAEVTRKLVAAEVYQADPQLGNLEHIRSEPMSALHIFTDQTAEELGIQSEHAFLTGSHFCLSFINNSQHWAEMEGKGTYLSFIASKFSPLRGLSEAAATKLLLGEIVEYLPKLDRSRIRETYLNPNTDAPLYINTVGSWAHRPRSDSVIDRLFFAGDYVRNAADLACMEGAVFSGINAAHVVTRQHLERSESASANIAPRRPTLRGRVLSAFEKARVPKAPASDLLPRPNAFMAWSTKISAIFDHEETLPLGVSPPPKVPATLPRWLYRAAYLAGLTSPMTWVALGLARLDEGLGITRIEHSLASQAADANLRDASYERRRDRSQSTLVDSREQTSECSRQDERHMERDSRLG